MSIVDDHIARLRREFPQAQLVTRPDGSALVRIPDYPLPAGWNAPTTEIVFLVPVGYPMAQPDTFWASDTLRLSIGSMPANSQLNANYGGQKPLVWFSFHPSAWNPQLDDLYTYAKLVRRRLSEAR